MVVFVSSLCAFVHFSHGAWRALVSPEFKRDLERLRYQRRMRKAARRRM
jgi:hypothetical protein